ncbi:hypothetical protein [Actinomyces trachealis]|uniref:hypothetical protein n=1 Tax=Actinomyces trachealis TaxID=2763540 RepID=UPI001892BD1D|nr:hypothetical protein [Actinomyces trachealis]
MTTSTFATTAAKHAPQASARARTHAEAPRSSGLRTLSVIASLTRRGMTDRTWLWFALTGVALGAFTTVIDSSTFLETIDTRNQAAVDAVALRLLRLGFALLLVSALWGATQVTSEFRDGTVAGRVNEHRGIGRLVCGHALASLPMGLVFGLIGVLSAGVPTWFILRSKGLTPTLDGEVLTTALGIVAVTALAAPWGTCFGWVIRRALPASLVLIVWAMFIEPALVPALPKDAGQYLPGGLQLTLIHDATAVGSTPITLAAALLVAWVAVAGVIATIATRKGDLRV